MKPDDGQDEWEGMQTKAVHASREHNTTHAVSSPIWQTSSFRADSPEHFAEIATAARPAEFYTRYGNPTHKQAEATIAALEGGEAALLAASGMGAIFTAMLCNLRAGDHVVAQRNLYAGTTTLVEELLARWGIEHTFVSQTGAADFAAAVRPTTKLICVETPTNPLMLITDLRAVAALGRERGITTMVDNTFATPINQRPLELGIDVCVHSATKYLGGHNDITAGVIVGASAFVERAWKFGLVTGAVLGPFDAWLLLRGLRTLGLRIERHNRNAVALARFLETHPRVERVHYPGLPSHPQHELARAQMSGFTGMFGVEVRGGFRAAEKFMGALKLGVNAASLGGHGTLVVHPAAMWGRQLTSAQRAEMSIGDSLVRVSVGLEDEVDLLKDFARALDGLGEFADE
ncbi:MAG TPA: aminotransferase class I/II-fold pyridoxal phosphate-dependent enzyme [Pyrinomonadaceae bacterium]|nr:aminotransferase class I/II-fold pyridoxal phosphate-dependent enzyme [Pyrinomonadaceae bacterium]